MVCVGIDLGTTYSCVSIMENGRPKAIHQKDGNYIVPSVVAYLNGEILVGNVALESNIGIDMKNILYDSKRLIGHQFLYNLPVAESRQLWSFDVETRKRCAGYVLNKGTNDDKFLKPEEVSAEILKYLKSCAENYLDQEIKDVVVTVPAFFSKDQRSATKRAVKEAGLSLKRLLHEPNAAAMAYNELHKLGNSQVMVFDFGGGTLDVSILQLNGTDIKINAITGDNQLGGQDFDGRIMNYAIDEFRKTSKYDIRQSPKFIQKLRTECRKAKESLSHTATSYNIHVEMDENDEVNVELTRDKFNDLCSDFFKRAMNKVDEAINSSRISVDAIDYVLLVGGSAKILRVKELLEKKFGKEKLKDDFDPDTIIANGAAIVGEAIEKASQFDKNVCINEKEAKESNNPRDGSPPTEEMDDPEDNNAIESLRDFPVMRFDLESMCLKINDSIAIDIGTSSCKIAVCKNGEVNMIKLESIGSYLIPTYLAYKDYKWLFGDEIREMSASSSNIHDIRWLLGKSDREVRDAKKSYAFKLCGTQPNDEIATFEIQWAERSEDDYSNWRKRVSRVKTVKADEALHVLLREFIWIAYHFVKFPATVAVTIPANSDQKYIELVEKIVKDAIRSCCGELFPKQSLNIMDHNLDDYEYQPVKQNAGRLKKLRFTTTPFEDVWLNFRTTNEETMLIEEAIAVAAGYAPSLNLHDKGDAVLVFNMGARYLQVAPYFMRKETDYCMIFKIFGVDTTIKEDFGGDYINELISEKLIEKITMKNDGKRPYISNGDQNRLKNACEKAKCELSISDQVEINLPQLYTKNETLFYDQNDVYDFNEIFKREEIEGFYREELHNCIKELKNEYLEKHSIDFRYILLAGGSTKLPLITELFRQEFTESSIQNSIDVYEVAAKGAASIVSEAARISRRMMHCDTIFEITKNLTNLSVSVRII
ncbi:hypothetical protein WR25_05901 isoform E [Diploscapter pachys]|uniref:Uncharacterized protein n=1 Tax=Diploscapter pachys TaxID=2018661 RepID=A0A2A2KF62_9BILA|nr:hypothetical protein WR25_05901 isoform E [Diploscapter pachys]